MIENTDSRSSMPSDASDGDVFPTFIRPHADSDVNTSSNDLSGSPFSYETGYVCTVALADELIEKIRKAAEETEVQQQHEVPLTPKAERKPASSAPSPAQTPTSKQDQPEKKKNKNDSTNHQQLIDRLNKKPHVIEFKGVVLDRNERLKIIAAVAMCESAGAPFGAVNADQEFVGREAGAKGIETSYSRIVHIGLSYGVIQFTQDGGALGGVLEKCNAKNHDKFVQIFGDNYQELLTLTDSGIVVPGVDYASGLDHWHDIAKKKEGKEISVKASSHKLTSNEEIRGKRVQPIPVVVGGIKQDLWSGTWKQRFKDAADVVDFQEAQLDYSVEHYLNPTLPFCKENNVRSALAIAFAVACKVRGVHPRLLMEAAKVKKIKTPFES